METKHCPACRLEQPVEQPPCAEHAECPEWICVVCGTAILVGWLASDAPVLPQPVSTAA